LQKKPNQFLKRAGKKFPPQLLKTVHGINKEKSVENKKFLYSLCGIVSIACFSAFFYFFRETSFTHLPTPTHYLTYPSQLGKIPELPDIVKKCPINVEIEDIEDIKEILPDEKSRFSRNQNKILMGLGLAAVVGTVIGFFYLNGGGVNVSSSNSSSSSNSFNISSIPRI